MASKDVDVAKMALYSLSRADDCIVSLSFKPIWAPYNTSSFDCMHYLGNAALENAASSLNLKSGDRVLDIGSGFSGTGRYLHLQYGVKVIGVEFQQEMHSRAELITRRNGIEKSEVSSVCGDILTVDIPNKLMDHIVSLLCFLHIPDREKLFEKAASLLKAGGRMYIEDYYARSTPLSASTAQILDEAVSCPYLPSKEKYIEDLEKAGFRNIVFEDMSANWGEFVNKRAVKYREKEGEKDFEQNLARFYEAVDGLFAGGEVGGVRISCTLKPKDEVAIPETDRVAPHRFTVAGDHWGILAE